MDCKPISCAVSLILALIAGSGCTHAQLRRSTLWQGTTLADIQCQQVLDNVARFTANPAAMPYFPYAGTGSTQVSDTGTLGPLSFSWIVPSQGIGLQAARGLTETWNLTAVNNPDKLYAMRCAYQILVNGGSDECDDCIQRLASVLIPPGDAAHPVNQVQVFAAKLPCYIPTGWYYVGRRHNVPKGACYVSHCCDTYVWVTASGMDGLAKFTLTMLDIATLSAFFPPSSAASGTPPVPATMSGAAPTMKAREPSFMMPGPTYVPTFPR